MTNTPDDPAAIDYDKLIAKLGRYANATDPFHSTTMNQAIAAVEALRARVKALEVGIPVVTKWYREWQARAETAEARVAWLERQRSAETEVGVKERIEHEALRKRVAELEATS